MMSINSPEFRDLRATAIHEREIEEKEKIIKEQNKKLTQKDQEIEQLKKRISNRYN